MSETIVVALDQTEAAQHAITAAGDLAARLGDRVLVVHVVEEVVTGRGSVGGEDLHAIDDVLAAAVKSLEDRGIEVEGRAVPGVAGTQDVAESIVQQATRAGAAYIFSGTHGRSAVGKLVLGSVVNKIIRTAECPVVVVR